MSPPPRPRRLLVSSAIAVGVLALAFLPARSGLGQAPASEPKLPTDLLKAQPFDRLTLIDNSVWLIEPVSPRPLPEYDPVKAREAARKAAREARERPNIGNVGVPKKDEPKEEPVSEDLVIHLMEGDIRDYLIKRTSIKKIDYFEDLLIAEGERLIYERRDPSNFSKAFEHFLLAEARAPDWMGLDEKVDKLLLAEGSEALLDQDRERGVRLLRELNARSPSYPGLADKLAQAYGGRINESFEKGQFPYARRILHDLESISPNNPLVRESRDKFTSKAKGLLALAGKAEGPEKLETLKEALRVWPTADGAADRYEEAFRATPTLDVAVLDLPRPAGPFIRGPAGERVARLLYLPLLANDSEDAARGRLANQLVAGLELGEIGQRIDLKLKAGPTWSDGSRPVSAIDAMRAISDRAQPRSPGYSARWADLLERVEITDQQQVSIRLTRPILKPEAWLLGPVGPAHAAWDGRVPSSDGTRKPVGDGPFVADTESADSASYNASNKGDASAPSSPPRVLRLREVRMTDGDEALGALVRGEVTMVEHVSPDRVTALQAEPEIRVGRYARPSLHRLAIDGRNPLLRNRSLRRGMAYAIDRKAILEENVLKRPIDAANAPSDGPFAFDSYANAPEVKPYASDMLLARMLVAAGKKEMNAGTIRLTLEYPAIPEARAAVPRIAEGLRAAGLEIDLKERSGTDLEQALRAGERFDLAYRVSTCEEPVWEVGPMLCPGYDAPSANDPLAALASPRIMQLLLELEHVQDMNSAKDLVREIDRECRDENPILALWQLQDYYAYRSRLSGPGETADHLYQGIDRWQIEPWFAKDSW